MTISAQEIEMERLKTTVMALNTKASIVDDHKNDVDNHYSNHQESESMRVDLHTHITTTKI
jgi:hypothetical protein